MRAFCDTIFEIILEDADWTRGGGPKYILKPFINCLKFSPYNQNSIRYLTLSISCAKKIMFYNLGFN